MLASNHTTRTLVAVYCRSGLGNVIGLLDIESHQPGQQQDISGSAEIYQLVSS